MRSVHSACRAMLAGIKLWPQDWYSVIPAIASSLNEESMDRLGRRSDGLTRSPLDVVTGILPKRSLLRVLPANVENTSVKTIDRACALQLIRFEELQKTLEEIHKDVHHSLSLRRERAVPAYNKTTYIVVPSFAVGDFVLVRRAAELGTNSNSVGLVRAVSQVSMVASCTGQNLSVAAKPNESTALGCRSTETLSSRTDSARHA